MSLLVWQFPLIYDKLNKGLQMSIKKDYLGTKFLGYFLLGIIFLINSLNADEIKFMSVGMLRAGSPVPVVR